MARSNNVVRTTYVNGDAFHVFVCEDCSNEFARPVMRGVKPMSCPECTGKPGRVKPAAIPAPAVAAVEPLAMPVKPRHYRFRLILDTLRAGVHAFLVGPAGSGKSSVSRHVADELGIEFYAESGHELMTAYDLLGFRNASGEFVTTNLYRAMEFGGVFLMDEMDAMNAAALVAINNIAALSAGDKYRAGDRDEIVIHDDFHLIGGGNTWGRGANGAYVTRQQLDAATLDRFACIEFGYDESLEFLAAGVTVPATVPSPPRYRRGSAMPDSEVTDWVREVQRYRKAFESAALDGAMVTPRASINGARLLRAGIHKDYVIASLIRKGLSDDEWRTVKACLPAAA